MKKIHANRLRKLADHLKKGKLGHKNFDFGSYNADVPDGAKCGTAGCALGECPFVFPRDWEFCGPFFGDLKLKSKPRDLAFNCAVEFFGVEFGEVFHLFYPNNQLPEKFGGIRLKHDATSKEVAANIYAFLKAKGF